MSFRFRRRAPAIIIAFAAVIIAAMAVFVHELTDEMIESAQTSNYKLMGNVLADVLRDNQEGAMVRAELISSLPGVRKAFAKRDREALLAECKEMFEEQRDKYGMDEGQFHVPPGISFLRLHAPAKFGDDQSKTRPILADVFKNKAHKHGIVLAPTGVFVTAVVPMEDMDGKNTGAFEMGLEFSPVLDEMKKAYGIEAAYFIDEKMLRETATELKGDVISEKNRVGRYMRVYSTHTELMKELVSDSEVEVTDAKSHEHIVHGATWGVELFPLYDYNNHQIGVFALAKDFSDVVAMEGRAKVWQVLAAFVAIILMTGVILIVIRGTLLRPLASLSERMRALADGDASKPADDSATYCEELGDLAESYERLRAGKQS